MDVAWWFFILEISVSPEIRITILKVWQNGPCQSLTYKCTLHTYEYARVAQMRLLFFIIWFYFFTHLMKESVRSLYVNNLRKKHLFRDRVLY
jgi:hypothetical protein